MQKPLIWLIFLKIVLSLLSWQSNSVLSLLIITLKHFRKKLHLQRFLQALSDICYVLKHWHGPGIERAASLQEQAKEWKGLGLVSVRSCPHTAFPAARHVYTACNFTLVWPPAACRKVLHKKKLDQSPGLDPIICFPGAWGSTDLSHCILPNKPPEHPDHCSTTPCGADIPPPGIPFTEQRQLVLQRWSHGSSAPPSNKWSPCSPSQLLQRVVSSLCSLWISLSYMIWARNKAIMEYYVKAI